MGQFLAELFLFWQLIDNSLKLHISEFSQFWPDLIAPINFGSRRTSPPSPQVSVALIDVTWILIVVRLLLLGKSVKGCDKKIVSSSWTDL